MDYTYEKNRLFSYLGEHWVKMLKQYNCFVAGGTITSLFSRREINDIDIYFRNEEDVLKMLEDVWGTSDYYIVSHTNKATLVTDAPNELDVQLIHFNYFSSAEKIFDSFDFTVCMGAFDFKDNQFILHEDFLKHNAQSVLRFNPGTAYPIISLARVAKYKEKGYVCPTSETIRIALTCMDLDISSYEELEDHLGGMYGVNYDKLLEDHGDEEFDLGKVVEDIGGAHLTEDYFKAPNSQKIEDYEDMVCSIKGLPIKYMKIGDRFHRISVDDECEVKFWMRDEDKKGIPRKAQKIEIEDYLEGKKYYKFVKKINDRYYSYFDQNFEYKIGETAVAKDSNSGLHFKSAETIDGSQYSGKDGAVVIEAIVNPRTVKVVGHTTEVGECYVVREVPKHEYQKGGKPTIPEKIEWKKTAPPQQNEDEFEFIIN